MNFIKYLTLAAAILIGFNSCNKSESNAGKGDEMRVFIKIDNPGDEDKRSTSTPIAKPVATFNSGILYFTDGKDNITMFKKIVKDSPGPNDIDLTQLISTGVEIPNVPSATLKVYIWGNVPAGTNPPAVGNMSAVKSLMLSVNSQNDATGTVDKATLYGASELESQFLPGSTAKFKAHVKLGIFISRIEIPDITGTGDIKSFKISGIFINSYLSQLAMEGTLNISNWVDNGDVADTYKVPTAAYPTGTFMCDYNTNGIGTLTDKKYTPTGTGKVWAYNIISNKNAYATTAVGTPPHLVIRISDIQTISGAIIDTDRFLTIKTYNNSGGTPISTFVPGMVYKLAPGSITFDETVPPSPEQEDISVTVTVEIIKWDNETIKPNI